jgi:transcriptional regulator with XRE-family HTH domain
VIYLPVMKDQDRPVPDEDLPRFAVMIRDARRARNLRQIDLAQAAGVQQPAVSAWEAGKAVPTPSSLLALAELLGLEVRDLLEAVAGEVVPA